MSDDQRVVTRPPDVDLHPVHTQFHGGGEGAERVLPVSGHDPAAEPPVPDDGGARAEDARDGRRSGRGRRSRPRDRPTAPADVVGRERYGRVLATGDAAIPLPAERAVNRPECHPAVTGRPADLGNRSFRPRRAQPRTAPRSSTAAPARRPRDDLRRQEPPDRPATPARRPGRPDPFPRSASRRRPTRTRSARTAGPVVYSRRTG